MPICKVIFLSNIIKFHKYVIIMEYLFWLIKIEYQLIEYLLTITISIDMPI